MIYRDFNGIRISQLAMGCMRLPVVDGKDSDIDAAEAEKMVDLAYGRGVNYFDTAYGYHGGNSEKVLGRILSKYPRKSFMLADKFPGYDLSNMDKVKEIFEEQLKRCGVDYFDFYMFHNVCEMNVDHYLDDEKYGIASYLLKQKEEGRIKHLGMSTHGEYDCIKKFLDAYGDELEFCQIQLNYVDYQLQNANKKLELLAEYDIPVWVMEPMRGGRLANLSQAQASRLREARPDESTAAWAHRFLQELPQVVTVLTGASTMEQLEDNIKTFEEEIPLTDKDRQVLQSVIDEMLAEETVQCTACKYCINHCPMKLDIPHLISMYNENNFTAKSGRFIVPFMMMTMKDEEKPSSCIGCGSCEAVCPQKLPISATMAALAEQLGQA